MNCKSSIFIAAIFIANLLLQTASHCQQFHINFKNLNRAHGLPSNTVTGIVQDNFDYIWFATEMGLSRYDGTNFKNFKPNPLDSTSIGFKLIFDLIKDKKGDFWLCSDINQIDKYDHSTNTFIHYYTNDDAEIYGLKEDLNGKIWGKSYTGLYYVDKEKQKISKYNINNPAIDNAEIHSIAFDKDNYLYALIADKLVKINTENNAFEEYVPEIEYSEELKALLYIHIDSENIIWLITENEIGTYDLELNNYKTKLKDINVEEMRGMIEDDRKNLWIAINGLYFYDRKKDRFTNYKRQVENEHSMASNFTVAPFIDNQGTLWLSHDASGVDHCRLKNIYEFIHYKREENQTNTLSDNLVTCFESKRKDYLWVGTIAGLDYFDRNTSKFKKYLKGEKIYNVFEDKNNTTWVITIKQTGFEKNTYPIYKKEKNETDFKLYTNSKLNPDDTYFLFAEDDSYLWLFSYLGAYRIENNNISFYENGYELNQEGYRVNSCALDKNGQFWICSNLGLKKFIPKDKSWTMQIETNLPDASSRDILIDKQDVMWLVAVGRISKCNNYNEEKLTFVPNLSLNEISTDFYFFIIDDDDYLWIGSLDELLKFDKKSGEIISYSYFDGISDSSVGYVYKGRNNFKPVFKTVNEEIALGGKKGFSLFHTDSLKRNMHKPPVYFLDFQIFNKSVSVGPNENGRVILEKEIGKTKQLNLSYKDAVFSIEFIAIDYASANNIKYAYIMEGFETDWNYINGNQRKATYTNLPGGKYTFKVKAANDDGVWNEQGNSIEIYITPPFWKTWWFRIILSIIIISIITIFYKVRINIIKAQKKNLEIKVANRTRALNEANIQLEEKHEEILIQKEKLLVRTDNLREANTNLEKRQNEILAQKEEIQSQKEEIEKHRNEIEEHKNQLEKTVEIRTKDLIAAKEKAEESDKLKSSFLSNMSHEIRTPMNAIVGFSDLLTNKDITPEKISNYVNQIKLNSDYLLHLITDIIDLSKIEAGLIHINKSNFSVNKLLNELLINSLNDSRVIANKNLTIKISNNSNRSQLIINSDLVRIKQVLNNLIDNAIKYTHIGIIEIGYEILDNDKISFFVKDTGIGISADNQEIIFDRFRKVEDDKTVLYRGTGLGLDISKLIVETLQGKIGVKSEVGKGSEFYFNIPLIRPINQRLETIKDNAANTEVDLSNYTILIVEDEDSNFLLLNEILRNTKIKFFRAFDGLEAINMYKEKMDLLDLILMDIKLPKLNGISATKAILEINSNVPIIALSAYAIAGEDKEALDVGCKEYLTKPVKKDILIKKIGKYLH